MPDSTGMPTATEVSERVDQVMPNDTNATVSGLAFTEATKILPRVIAEFQAPVGRGGSGGTGRRFVPLVATRLYDGNGYPELRVDDIVPGASLTVQAFGTTYPDVLLKEGSFESGYNLLVRPQSSGSIMGASYGLSGIFPLGLQNISVTTTFGYAATVPDDVYGAILDECARRIVISQFGGVIGAGGGKKIGDYEVDKNTPYEVWARSSVMAVLGDNFKNTICAYREKGARKWKRIAEGRRMS